ncbi:HdeD family acid-resistance protein [Mucilaginibacter sp. AK015]|uniref:HdeD family acid-resistance protein n=1 Tax=Mucilaginibacter sp. AK015 TaxID=2723072 RepID=UPI001619E609|nr:DUF308 domain-containing protein [Mucilaginibacter sp. AK015]MBB5396877.1 uncharacterized membrane protein HdeD (DUF308 family) [Mucilaginibacter sp. AK015]
MSTPGVKKPMPDIRHWWLFPASGCVLTGMGIWILTEQLTAYLTVCIIFAIGIFVTGIIEFLFVLLTRRASGVTRWALLGAFVDLFIGIYLGFYPLISLVIVPVILGFWLVLRGILSIASAWQLHDHGQEDWAWLLLFGALVMCTGVLMLTNMIWGTQDIILHTGAAFVITGLFRIYLGFRFRNLKINNNSI